ncbi:hypothetical protein ABW19_dt0209426 [Dactylella cylindrospora]|nr:hypothetical protein ABW19_dt0209426 [Dactylella cylindrospora]
MNYQYDDSSSSSSGGTDFEGPETPPPYPEVHVSVEGTLDLPMQSEPPVDPILSGSCLKLEIRSFEGEDYLSYIQHPAEDSTHERRLVPTGRFRLRCNACEWNSWNLTEPIYLQGNGDPSHMNESCLNFNIRELNRGDLLVCGSCWKKKGFKLRPSHYHSIFKPGAAVSRDDEKMMRVLSLHSTQFGANHDWQKDSDDASQKHGTLHYWWIPPCCPIVHPVLTKNTGSQNPEVYTCTLVGCNRNAKGEPCKQEFPIKEASKFTRHIAKLVPRYKCELCDTGVQGQSYPKKKTSKKPPKVHFARREYVKDHIDTNVHGNDPGKLYQYIRRSDQEHILDKYLVCFAPVTIS